MFLMSLILLPNRHRKLETFADIKKIDTDNSVSRKTKYNLRIIYSPNIFEAIKI